MQGYQGFQQGGMQGQFNPNGLYDPQGNFQKKQPPTKTHIGTEEIREIVERLNAKPFDQNFTMVTFDELHG